MTPAARVAAVMEALGVALPGSLPAEQVLAAYLRRRRYIGSKDRRAITQRFYALLRSLSRIDWWLEAPSQAPSPRARVLAHLALAEGLGREEIAGLCGAGGYGPAPLSAVEDALLSRLAGAGLTSPEQPVWVRAETPAWLWPAFVTAFGPEAERELSALLPAAPLDLRVNSLKTDRETAQAALAEAGLAFRPTALSPLGLRIEGRPALQNLAATRDGWIEPQDEASQLAALLTDARAGMAVLDFCAGAGGKALALGAAMAGEGRLVLHDSDPERLARAKPRLARAGVANAAFSEGGADGLPGEAGRFDRVLVDAPCSGSGAWRRHPDARWRLQPADLAARCLLQGRLLGQAGDLVAPGGRLIYATCSLLPQENTGALAAFLEGRPDYELLPIEEVWQEALAGGADCPAPPGAGSLTLTPARHGCDGFFIAVLQRRSAS